ncbi:MAG TPA: ABC transporter ATP-binding protein [Candidatus Angelobacter sp.]|nr:ABC transporter ATP-binding protein [Candidatus Angelobacter sp.]
MASIRRLLTYVARYRAMLLWGILCLIAANLSKAAVPLILQQAVDALLRGITYSLLLRYSVMIIAAALLQGGFVFSQERLLTGMTRKIERDMKNDFYAHLQKMPLGFFRENRTGELMARATNDMNIAVSAGMRAFVYSLNTVVALLVILPLMARLSWRLTALAFAPLLLAIIATVFFQERMRSWSEKIQESLGEMCAGAQQALDGVRTVRTYTQERAEIEAFRQINQQYLSHNLRRNRLANMVYPAMQFFVGLSFLAVLWYGGNLASSKSLSIGQFLEFIVYLSYVAWPMHELGEQLTVLQQAVVSMGRLDCILSLQPAIQDLSGAAAIDRIDGGIEFRNVTYTPEGTDRPALAGVSFRIKPGQTVGLAGRVGSGKTTLMNMVPRLLDPCSGDILIDGHSVRHISLKLLRSAIGYVPQETFLFSDTIAANIAFGKPEATQAEIEQAAITAGLGPDIAAFPDSYQTIVGERGATLSGGQKQRISIARAVLPRSSILLLDDALSSVDSYTEEKILSRLRNLRQGKTCLISSHRISTLRDADLILVLHKGTIIERGTHAELLARGGMYAEMYETQLLEEDLAAS